MKMGRSMRSMLGVAVVAALLVPEVAGADDDHELARRALEAGEVLPLRAVLERIGKQYPGEIIEVELERDDGRWIYEIKVLRRGGGLLKLELDASDATVLGVKGRDVRPAGTRAGER